MFYLICSSADSDFCVKSFASFEKASSFAEWVIEAGFYDRAVMCESIAECFSKEEE